MPEQEVIETENEIEVPVAEDVQPEPEQAPVQDEGQDERRELWGEIVPELADEFDKLDVETRENILLKRLRAQAQVPGATTDSEDTDTATGPQKREPATVPEMSFLGAEAIQDAVQKAIDEGDANALSKVLMDQQTCMRNAYDRMMVVLSGHEGRIDEYLVLPTRFQAARDRVPGATDSDLAEALRLYKQGGFSDEVSALKVAVYDRQQELSAAQPKRTVDETAKRTAAAIAASRQSTTGAPKGGVHRQMPVGPDEERAFLQELQKGG